MEYDHNLSCPCSSGKPYSCCCNPFHRGVLPLHALQLMRSRYTAYAYDLPHYIIETTHPLNPHYEENLDVWTQEISLFSHHSLFKKLEILDVEEHEIIATVTFTAHIMQNGRDASFTEESVFEKVGNRWLYRSGIIS